MHRRSRPGTNVEKVQVDVPAVGVFTSGGTSDDTHVVSSALIEGSQRTAVRVPRGAAAIGDQAGAAIPARSIARRITSTSMAGVSRPVKVFCWLTW